MTALPQSRVPDPMAAPPVRWGILGTGMIAGAMAYAVRTGTRSRLSLVGSRTAESAARFAAEHQVERSVGSYAELVADPEVDIVYVARITNFFKINRRNFRNQFMPLILRK